MKFLGWEKAIVFITLWSCLVNASLLIPAPQSRTLLIQDEICNDIHKLPPEDQCRYISTCSDLVVGRINYLLLYYCHFKSFTVGLIVVGLVIYFICIGLVASDYLSHNLYYISNWLHLLDNVAGLTILAMGNSSPDILSNFKAMNVGEGNLAILELIGASFFINTIVIGCMAITHPFKLPKHLVVRDMVMFVLINCMILVSLVNNYISMVNCIALFSCYVIYVIYIIVNHSILRARTMKKLRDERIRNNYSVHSGHSLADIDEEEGIDGMDDDFNRHLPTVDDLPFTNMDEYDEDYQRELINEFDEFRRINEDVTLNKSIGIKQLIHELTSHASNRIQLTEERDDLISPEDSGYDAPSFTPYRDNENDEEAMLGNRPITMTNNEETSIEPEHEDQYHQTSSLPTRNGKIVAYLCDLGEIKTFSALKPIQKLAFILTFPIYVMIKLTVPIVKDDLDKIKISAIVLFMNLNLYFNFPSFILINVPVLASIIYSCVVTDKVSFSPDTDSKTDSATVKPRYNIFVASIGFINSILWISIFATEIINNLKTISIIYNISGEVLGFTVFAVGNSIGDLISNYTISKMGMPIMAFGACFGGPILSLSFLGLNGFIILINNENYSKSFINDFGYLISSSTTLIVILLGVILNLFVFLVLVMRNNWFLEKKIGIVLIINWVLVITSCTLFI